MVTIFSDFINEFPNIKIELTSYANYQLYHALEQRMIDIVLGLSFPKYPDYQKILIKKYPLIVLINKNNPLANQKTVSQEELPNILFNVRKLYYQDNYPEFEGNLLKIACNQGCAILHAFTKDNCYNDYLKAIPLTPLSEKSVYLIYDQDNYNPLISNFINYLKTTSILNHKNYFLSY